MEIFYIGEYMAAINNINIKAMNLSIKWSTEHLDHNYLNDFLSAEITPTSISDDLKSADKTVDKHVIATWKTFHSTWLSEFN